MSGFELLKPCRSQPDPCKMNSVLIFADFAFRGFHGSHFILNFSSHFHFHFVNSSANSLKSAENSIENWPTISRKRSTVNDPIKRTKDYMG